MVKEVAHGSQPEPNSAAILDKAVVFGGRTYTMHSRHWYDDGNFGFLVERTAFLVHRSFLASRSSVMADMFGLPQRASSQVTDSAVETINGIAFVVLQDKSNDFANVLDIIYTDITMADERRDLDVTALMGIVQFANKYLFDKVKEWGVSQILSSHALLVVEDKTLGSSLQKGDYSHPKFCVQVIQFAREFQLPQFLPLAFYGLATTDWDQKPREDFTAMDQLSEGDRWRIQEGRSALFKALVRQAYNMPENGCTGERFISIGLEGNEQKPNLSVVPTYVYSGPPSAFVTQIHISQLLATHAPITPAPTSSGLDAGMTSETGSNSSRLITEDGVVIDGRSYTKHHRHWYSDGSFGFLIEGTAFLLHRSLLSRRSSVMEDLFTLPQGMPTDDPDLTNRATATFNGISFATLHDKADEFASLMDLVYPATISSKAREDLDAVQLIRITLLADKYLVQDIKEWATGELESKHLLVGEGERPLDCLRDGKYSDLGFCVQVVRFARMCSLPQFLPFDFYALATADWTKSPGEGPLLLDDLSPQDRCRIQEGRIRLTQAMVKLAYTMPENGNSGAKCSNRGCRKDSFIWADPPARWAKLLFHPLEELHWRHIATYPLSCDPYANSLKERTRALRDDLVSHLKEYFQLE
ncbi:hypothetical protein FRC00_001106 [Tulasnella sp. 408]|nr:hypothetical protein FRC00_001106 [Tulasnella sp. 408]